MSFAQIKFKCDSKIRMNRPLFNKTHQELEEMFRGCCYSSVLLKTLAFELSYRKKPKSAILLAKVEAELAKFGKKKEIEPPTFPSAFTPAAYVQTVALNESEKKRINEPPFPHEPLVLQGGDQFQNISPPVKPRTCVREKLPAWSTWAMPLILSCLTFALIFPSKPHIQTLYFPEQPVHVSGYTRSDGTSISEYNRALPGDRANANEINEPRLRSNREEEKRFNSGIIIAIIGSLFAFFISKTVLKTYLEEPAKK